MADLDTVLREAQAQIGITTEQELGEITEDLIARYARAIGDDDPRYFDRNTAMRLGYPGIIAPPNLITSVVSWGAGLPTSELLSDGSVGTNVPGVNTEGLRIMGGGENNIFHAEVVAGVRVKLTVTLIEVEKRESRSGPMVILRYRDVFVDDRQTPLLTSIRTQLLR